MSNLFSNSVFFIDIEKIKPNPYQPRREFDPHALDDLSSSIRQYGVLQPLVVSRVERELPEGGLATEYELIAGERRLRASKIAGLLQVPVIVRVGDSDQTKLELAIIENLQREDLNVVERARAFVRLVNEFKFTHADVGKKVGKSREFVSNTLRILSLPDEILSALSEGKISEGHTRPLMMLADRPEEQMVLFKEIIFKKLNVREAERVSRRVAFERARKLETMPDPEISDIEEKLEECLGTRVHIERKEVGGKIMIDFFSTDDLHDIIAILETKEKKNPAHMLERHIDAGAPVNPWKQETVLDVVEEIMGETVGNEHSPEREEPTSENNETQTEPSSPIVDDAKKDQTSEDDLYNLKNFTI